MNAPRFLLRYKVGGVTHVHECDVADVEVARQKQRDVDGVLYELCPMWEPIDGDMCGHVWVHECQLPKGHSGEHSSERVAESILADESKLPDAIRTVTAKVQIELESGRRSHRIDAHDVVEILLAIADEMDSDGDRSHRSIEDFKSAYRDAWEPQWIQYLSQNTEAT